MTEPGPLDNPQLIDTPAAEPSTDWTRQFLDGLREMGPVVWVMGLMSVTLPGIVGTFVLFGSALGPERMRAFVMGLGEGAPWIAAVLFGVMTGSAMAPTYALSFACGVVFASMGVGGAVAMAGVVLGALVGYGWGVVLARKRVMDVVNRHEKARIIRHALLDRPVHTEAWLVGLIRFPPNSPFALTNLVLSSLRVRLVAFFFGTLVGMAPRTLFAVWLGTQVGDLAQAQAAGGRMRVIIGGVIGVVVFLLVYRIMSRWAKQALRDHARRPGPSGSTPGAA
jgi:uncharacterized membrane protein YdjX (TVP38/TMEM64 family)